MSQPLKKEPAGRSEMAKEITLSFLTKFIKSYNGDRDSLPAFLNNCENAMTLANSEQQSILTKFIISQLEGKAQVACSLKKFTSWSELKSFLRSTFGEKKHATHLLSDLQNSKQLSHEDVTKYALRIEGILTRLHSDIHYSCKDEDELPGRIAAMEDLALHSFLLGLNPAISTIVRCRNPSTLSDAIQYATDEEKLYNLSKINSKSFKQCSTCHKSGHSSSECYKNKKPNFQKSYHINPQNNSFTHSNSNPNSNSNSNSYQNKKSCNYCKRVGHTINECRKRQFNNQRQGNSLNQNNSSPSNSSKAMTHVCQIGDVHDDNLN